jgi:predicted  nucleic acid-binding Zn ribbon protein
MILTVNSVYFLKQNRPDYLNNIKAVCPSCGRHWNLKCQLHEL